MTHPLEIGHASAACLDRLRDTIEALDTEAVPDAAPILRTLRERLEREVVRVSIVGQVKAGKSSMINALTGVSDLLPTEVNPWTAVVTNLHFGHPGQTPGRAVFQFFGAEEWDLMLRGGSESRRLAEKYLPGFRTDVLTRQVAEMQERSRARLGEMYRLLLGKTHRFDHVTPEILARYVSAGYADNDMVRSTAGRFSSITRSADVYLEPGPFKVPMTISDTPGVNDPFLVRDEITTASLASADVFVATLSAHQVMNPADIALLRMLAHHEQRTTVVFVNRIDELDEPARNAEAVLAPLEARLAREVGGAGYVVLAGSAEWARIAVSGSDAAVAATLAGRDCAAYAQARAIPADLPPRERLLAASGFPALAAELGRIGFETRTRGALSQAVSGAVSGIDFLHRAMGARLQAETGSDVGSVDTKRLAKAEEARIDARLAALAKLSGRLVARTRDCRRELAEASARTARSVAEALEVSITSFCDEQIVAFLDSENAAEAERWSFDTLAIQEQTRLQVSSTYESGRDGLDAILHAYAVDLDAELAPVVGSVPVEGLLKDLPNERVLANFRPTSKFVEIELTAERGWHFWKSRLLDESEAADRISEVIRAELKPAVGTLNATVVEALAERGAAVSERLSSLIERACALIAAEIDDLERDAALLRADGAEAMRARLATERKERAETLRAKVEALDHLSLCLVAAVPEISLDPLDAPAPALDAEAVRA